MFTVESIFKKAVPNWTPLLIIKKVTVEIRYLVKLSIEFPSVNLKMSSVIVDQRAEANKYIQEKKINKLFDILGAQLARQKPEDPNEFLVNELKRISDLKANNQTVINLDSW